MKVKVTYATGAVEVFVTETNTLKGLAMEKWGLDTIEEVEALGVTLEVLEGEELEPQDLSVTPDDEQPPVDDEQPPVEEVTDKMIDEETN